MSLPTPSPGRSSVASSGRSESSPTPTVTTPIMRRDGSITAPLSEQAHFVLAIREVFLASRAPDDDAYWRVIRRAMQHARLEGRARWIAVLGVDPLTRSITAAAADGIDVSGMPGRYVDAVGIPAEVFAPPRVARRTGGSGRDGLAALLCAPDEHLVSVALWGGGRLLGVLLAGIDERSTTPEQWLEVLADFLAWTAKGRTMGGALPGLGLPSAAQVVESAPDARWMAAALELCGLPIAVSAFPGQMSYVNGAGRQFMANSGVQDYAADIDPNPSEDVDEMAWRAQVMTAAVADPEGRGRMIVRVVPDGAGGELAIRFAYRVVRHPLTGSIERLVMLIEPARHRHAPTEPPDQTQRLEHPATSDADAGAEPVPPGGLTPRRRAVAARLVRGDRPAMIATDLGLSVHTVRGHISALYRHTGANDLSELIESLREQIS